MRRLAVVLAIATLLCLCAGHHLTKAGKITVVDDLGYRVTVKRYPKRIVSLAPSNTEILFAIGAGNRVVGVTKYCDYPPKAVKLIKEGKIAIIGGYTTVNIEKVVELKPDLVVASYGNGIETIQKLRSLGIPVVCLNPKNLTQVMHDIWLLGVLTGEEKNASKLISWMKRKIYEIERIVSKAKSRPTVVHIIWNKPIWVSGRGTFVDELIRLAGGVNAVKKKGWVEISKEELLEMNPDVIIVNSGGGMGGKGKALYNWLIHDPVLSKLKAVKEGRVYVINADIVSRPSYRLVYALEDFARFIHPELFKNATAPICACCGNACTISSNRTGAVSSSAAG